MEQSTRQNIITWIIIAIICLVWVIVVLLFNITSDQPEVLQHTPSEEDYELISYGDHVAGYDEFDESIEWEFVITSEEEYKEKFDKEPQVGYDFDGNVYVFVFMWEKPTAWYNIIVDGVSFYSDEAIVDFVYQEPGENCMVHESSTTPYKIIKLEDVLRDVSLEFEEQEADC